jgi:hypothetical protein
MQLFEIFKRWPTFWPSKQLLQIIQQLPLTKKHIKWINTSPHAALGVSGGGTENTKAGQKSCAISDVNEPMRRQALRNCFLHPWK